MSDEFPRRDDFNGYTEREILLLLVQKVDASLPVINKRLDFHAGDIKTLKGVAATMTGASIIIGIVLGWFKIGAKVQ